MCIIQELYIVDVKIVNIVLNDILKSLNSETDGSHLTIRFVHISNHINQQILSIIHLIILLSS